MKLIHVKGDTWYLDGPQSIPLYKVTENTCILLDAGEITDREMIEQTLKDHQLQLVGIIGTHVHTDHSPNHSYFQRKYDIPVALPLGEGGVSSSRLALKAYFYMFTEQQIDQYQELSDMAVFPDKIIMPEESHIYFCDTKFDIIHTPGHSPDHISILTPDGVLYLGDALLTIDTIVNAKIPYFFSLERAIETMEQLKEYRQYLWLSAHRGICEDIESTIETNIRIIRERSQQIASCLKDEMTFDQLLNAVCQHFSLLSGNMFKCKVYERNIRTFIEYLVDIKVIDSYARKGIIYYRLAEE